MKSYRPIVVAYVVFAVVAQREAVAQPSDKTYALLPTERTSNVLEEEVTAYHSSIAQELAAGHIAFQERTLVVALLREADLAAALSPQRANRAYQEAQFAAEVLFIPSICRIENDYMLVLRQVSRKGVTIQCSTRTTRTQNQFASLARDLVAEHFQASLPGSQKGESSSHEVSRVRALCIEKKANLLFPELWDRTQALEEQSDPQSRPDIDHYYTWMLQLTAIACSPPEAMHFIPGGWVPVPSDSGIGRVWVEPFFCDVHQVTLKHYRKFLDASSLDAQQRYRLKPIPDPAAVSLLQPVTGITWAGANAYAEFQGKQLPADSQWLRVLIYLDEAACNKRTNPSGTSRNTGDDHFLVCLKSMKGNVREWTSSWDGPYQRGRGNILTEPADGVVKLIRGAVAGPVPDSPELFARSTAKPGEAFSDVGFRCVRSFFRRDYREASTTRP